MTRPIRSRHLRVLDAPAHDARPATARGDEDPEFAPGVDEAPLELDRREMMKLLGAGAGLAGLGSIAACMAPPNERILPRVEQPPELTPGVPVAYATSMVIDGFATGLVVQTYEARPTKIEGNPDHPASLGATTALHQAAVLELYDPHRARAALDDDVPIDVADLLRTIARREPILGLWFLLEPQSSPLLADLIQRVRARHPGARFATYAPLERRDVYEGARLAFGRPLEAHYRFDRAEVVVSLDADFTAAMPNSVRWSHDFAARRRPGTAEMSRLYVAEPRPSPTGSLADHHLPARPSRIAVLARALLATVRGQRAGEALEPRERAWVAAAAADLAARRGRGLVVAGDRQPAAVHALAHQLAGAIDAIGQTVTFTRPALIDPLGDGLGELAAALRAGQVQTLVVVAANPAYTASRELGELIARVPDTLCVAHERHETAAHCRRFVPLAHALESWGDARAYDGTISLIQPMIRPLFESVTPAQLLAAFAGDAQPDGLRLLRERYVRDPGGELAWQQTLRLGLIANSAFAPEAVQVGAPAVPPPEDDPAGGFEVSFDRSHAVYDGRFAGNPWLQELPKPHEKITWGNAAIVSPATARALDVDHEDVVRIARDGIRVELPVYVQPGHADGCVSLELGYGRRAGGPIAEGVGVDVYPLRPLHRGYITGAQVAATGEQRAIAVTQQHFDQDGRNIAPAATLAYYRAHPDFTEALRGRLPTMLPDYFTAPPQWGMTIDTSICTGCSACVIACQAENNIPVVGKQGVIDNREMHWLRIDTYREEVADDVRFVHQPMLCQHCEHAPCEYVCPVYATQHSPDGLNEMVYNRCIGTRFCSNNCPYKVRRFNWFDYTEDTPKPARLQFNPNVTVRARGVMEKCTFCVQRIRAAEIAARKDGRDIAPGEVVTACQQACPTNAITFGQLHHRDTDVVTWREQPRRYAVLHHLGTRPRTIYLAKIINLKPGRGTE
jgi:molybdopterin-containing oxidoreductase family iron-sulfur binding subunit